MSGRKLAVQLLDHTEKEKSYSNILLDHALSTSTLNETEKRLCAMLYYGVIKRRITLDTVLQKYSRQPLQKLDGIVRNILRIGVYQLLYCDRIPPHAAVGECVKLTRSMRKSSASGYVNAVLRSFLRDDCCVPMPTEKDAAMAVEYAVPQWLLQQLLAAYGAEKTEAFLADALKPAPRYIRRNPCACSQKELEHALGDRIEPVSLVPDAYLLHAGDIRDLMAYQKGWFYVQDLASQICALALGAKAGETVLDLCAAPGGKSCTIAAQMQNQGHVYAFDLAEHRVALIAKNAKRLGLDCITVQQGDALEFKPAYRGADRVLCDVPCSGIGVLRHKPEVKEKTPEEIATLPQLQIGILEQAARYVKRGGVLEYSTCTLLPQENEAVVQQFLKKYPEFMPQPVFPELGGVFAQPMVTLFPEICGSDGFFMAKFVRREENKG